MRIVIDTNTVVSGFFWRGAPRMVLDLCAAGTISAYSSAELLAELQDVLLRPKFAPLLAKIGANATQIAAQYAGSVYMVASSPLPAPVSSDPDDDHVLACAVAAKADFIVTGDRHLLMLKRYQSIEILQSHEMLARLSQSP